MAASEKLLLAYQSVFGKVVMHIDGMERRGVVWPEWAPALFLHVLSFVGGVFVIYLGIETVRSLKAEVTVDKQVSSQHVLWPAVATNFLNPHPYLFWATVGGTLLVQSFTTGGIAASAAFVVSLYAFLVGAKLGIAFLLSRSQGWLKGRTYHAMLVGSGLLLIGLGLLLIWEGVQHFL